VLKLKRMLKCIRTLLNRIGGYLLKSVWFYLIALVIIIIDQISKFLIVTRMEYAESIEIIKNVFYITSHRNRGAAFGILQGQMWLFFIITTIVIIGVIYYFHAEGKAKLGLGLSLSLILGGAIGNFIDRIFRGEVVDFINVYIINYNYPIFNVADSALVVGVIIIAIYFLFEGKQKEHE
jgi:signal peptidase II